MIYIFIYLSNREVVVTSIQQTFFGAPASGSVQGRMQWARERGRLENRAIKLK